MQACRLVASQLACRRGDRVLLRDVEFALGPGDILHLAGPNGIGKSSLIRILAGLLPPFAGAIERFGALALADERPALDPQLALGLALRFWARLDGIADLMLAEAIAVLGIESLLEVPVRYLSTGQRKRAVLARVLAGGAPIWLLDEPLNGLDRDGSERLASAIGAHRAAGGAVLAASHVPMAGDWRMLELGR